MSDVYKPLFSFASHAPHGACELKFQTSFQVRNVKGHAPHGACELKSKGYQRGIFKSGHAPHGACELKSKQIRFLESRGFVTLPTERVS